MEKGVGAPTPFLLPTGGVGSIFCNSRKKFSKANVLSLRLPYENQLKSPERKFYLVSVWLGQSMKRSKKAFKPWHFFINPADSRSSTLKRSTSSLKKCNTSNTFAFIFHILLMQILYGAGKGSLRFCGEEARRYQRVYRKKVFCQPPTANFLYGKIDFRRKICYNRK